MRQLYTKKVNAKTKTKTSPFLPVSLIPEKADTARPHLWSKELEENPRQFKRSSSFPSPAGWLPNYTLVSISGPIPGPGPGHIPTGSPTGRLPLPTSYINKLDSRLPNDRAAQRDTLLSPSNVSGSTGFNVPEGDTHRLPAGEPFPQD